jgi:hypothetical protein
MTPINHFLEETSSILVRKAPTYATGKFVAVLLMALFGQAHAQVGGGALLFDGSDDFATVSHQDELSFAAGASATIELWLNPASDRTIWHALGKRQACASTANMNYQLARDSASLVHFNTTGCAFSATIDLPVGDWSHVALTADGSTFRFFVNGELVNQADCVFGGENTSPLNFGKSDDCGQTFHGMIDEVRIWNFARSNEDMTDGYKCELESSLPGLVGYWKFDEESDSQTILDSSGSGFHGTLGGDLDPSSQDPQRVGSTAPFDCYLIFRDGFEVKD